MSISFSGWPTCEGRGVALVAGVGAGAGIAGFHGVAERGVADRAGPAAVADSLELAVPAETGSQTSILMSESLDGFSVAFTRQNAGTAA
jgi:hypothetical protein